MRFSNSVSDEAALEELGRRVADVRLARGMTQAQLAAEAGVSKRTVERLEDGASVQLGSFIRCLRALERLQALEALLPEQPVNPLQLLNRERPRRRARSAPPSVQEKSAPWSWGDDDAGGDTT